MRRQFGLASLLVVGLAGSGLAAEEPSDPTPRPLMPILSSWWRTLERTFEAPQDITPLRGFVAGASPILAPEPASPPVAVERLVDETLEGLGLKQSEPTIEPPRRAP